MSTTPPNKPRRRIAGEARPGDEAKKPNPPRALRAGGAPTLRDASPTAGLPKAPTRTDNPRPPNLATSVKLPKLDGVRTLPVSAWALIALTIAALIFGVTGAVAGVRHFRGDDVGVAREDASDAAAAAAETIFSYQWNKLKQHLSDSQDLMTPKFAKEFESISPALNALAPQRRIQVKAVVRNAATIECGDKCAEDKATVLVFIDQARVADGLKKPAVFGNRIEMSMVKRNGDWLVGNVKAL